MPPIFIAALLLTMALGGVTTAALAWSPGDELIAAGEVLWNWRKNEKHTLPANATRLRFRRDGRLLLLQWNELAGQFDETARLSEEFKRQSEEHCRDLEAYLLQQQEWQHGAKQFLERGHDLRQAQQYHRADPRLLHRGQQRSRGPRR